MSELDPAQTAADAEAIAAFCRYELVTLTQLDAHRVQASFPGSSDHEESVIGSSLVSVLLEVARRQKAQANVRGTRAAEQIVTEALHKLPVALTITKGEQGYTWQVFTRTGTVPTLMDALARRLEATIAQGGDKSAEERKQ